MVDKELFRLIGGNKKYIFIAVLLQAIGLVANVAITGSVCYAVYLLTQNAEWIQFIYPLIGAAIGILVRYLCSRATGDIKDKLGRKVKKDLRERVYNKIVKLGVKTTDGMSMAGLTQVSVEGVEQLDLYYSSYLPQFFFAMIAPVILFLICVWIDWRTALVDKVFHVGNKSVSEITDRETYLKEQSAEMEDTCMAFSGTLPVFSLADVAFSVKDRGILNGVTFDVLKGSRTVLLGENGCGKTTLLRLISRLEKPTRGVILQNIDDKFGQKSKQSKKWYQKVGVVYQNPDYQLFMPTVEKEIKFGAKSPEYADEIAEKFGIKHLYARHPQSLSEGQKRRVSIAAVVATDPEVLILDEPTVGQDYRGLCKMVEVLNRIHTDTKNTMITVTHDCRCAAALCDRAVWIENGTVRHAGGKEQISAFFRLDVQCKG